MNRTSVVLLSLLGCIFSSGDGFSTPAASTIRLGNSQGRWSSSSVVAKSSENGDNEDVPVPTSEVVRKVAVAGATGKTGKLVVDELLSRNVKVVGLIRNETKAEELFGDYSTDALELHQCKLTDPEDVAEKLVGCDATVWCATGFTEEAMGTTPPTGTMSPELSVDVMGVPAVAGAMLQEQQQNDAGETYARVVMCSSAGTTRPSWDEEKKEKLKGCADIPIVRLNPFGILGLKAQSEAKLRETGVDYCIVRPCGLNDKWPEGARPVFSQGDVAVGRLNRKDLAKVLCDVLSLPEACNKTFEMVGLAGYPPPRGIGPALERLKLDSEDLSEAEVEAAFAFAQQLLPGESQNAAALAMGQTYEQLDKGETGRLGERGKENLAAAGIRPTTA
eukprot:CAMPEP_0201170468 /NCGR_PEP_ID=MMETSP0851-20130426/84112_1 /ASSEMBLY_ACC=CAM_ASM_000631 /TAXON_ID=183588 /ORGANISM="Pseudo-nitzschia fraudulenta, Strain WWA7" /LENGTH=389 /DNA_ID=CAMNT_0047452511 /DNA_START=44 /DNA_END=1213 /DNA_ORIENTATION=+